MRVTAIDFETANPKRESICSVGISVYEDGKEVEYFYSLVRPNPYNIAPYNQRTHGLSYGDFKDAEPFDVVYKKFSHMLSGLVVAHNAAFDIDCLSTALYLRKIPFPDFTFLCTREMACVSNLSCGEKLDELCSYLGIDLYQHHNALCDARACAQLFFAIKEKATESDVARLTRKFTDRIGIEEYQAENDCSDPIEDIGEVKSDLPFKKPAAINIEGCKFVVTGEFESIPRKDLELILKSKGGKIQATPSKTTNYIIVGNIPSAGWKNGNYGGKIEKALELNTCAFIRENDFLQFVR